MEQPHYYWDPVIAPSGLAFYTGNLFPQWKNSVFVGALRGHMLDRLTLSGKKVIAEEPLLVDQHSRIRDVRMGPEGGFELLYGDESAAFSSLKVGEVVVNLSANPGYEHRWWGRVIFRVDDVDAHYRSLQAQGLIFEPPRDASWGERFFHVTDPGGHELSFAELLPVGG